MKMHYKPTVRSAHVVEAPPSVNFDPDISVSPCNSWQPRCSHGDPKHTFIGLVRRGERETERHEGSPGLTGKKAVLSISPAFHVAVRTKIFFFFCFSL